MRQKKVQVNVLEQILEEGGEGWYTIRFEDGFYFSQSRAIVQQKRGPSAAWDLRSIIGWYYGVKNEGSFHIRRSGDAAAIPYKTVKNLHKI